MLPKLIPVVYTQSCYAGALYCMMSDFSEEVFQSYWILGNEQWLWGQMQLHEDTRLSASALDQLYVRSEEAGGWIVYLGDDCLWPELFDAYGEGPFWIGTQDWIGLERSHLRTYGNRTGVSLESDYREVASVLHKLGWAAPNDAQHSQLKEWWRGVVESCELSHGYEMMVLRQEQGREIERLRVQVAQLLHDLKLVLGHPVFRDDPVPLGQKVVLYTPGHICTVGHSHEPGDAEAWCELPMTRARFELKRKYKGDL